MKKINRILSLVLALVLLCIPTGMFTQASAVAGKWVASWGTSIVDGNIKIAGIRVQDFFPSDSTIRIELQVTTGGEKLKFKFSNEYGSEPITFGEVSVAKTIKSGKTTIDSASSIPVTFHGQKSITIPAGKTIWSDAIAIATSPLERISLSIFFDKTTKITSTGLANARTFLSTRPAFGNKSQVTKKSLSIPSEVNISSGTITYHTTPFLSEIDTYTRNPKSCSAVFIGDSTLVNNTYLHYAEKLVNAGYKNVGIINEAVIGNKLMSDGTGLIGNLYGNAMIKRFNRDALSISGVKYIFVKIGLNDIAHQFSKSLGRDTPKLTAAQIIEGYKDITARAHANGIKIYFFTKSPWKGYERSFLGQKGDLQWNKTMQKMCDELDQWVKTTNLIDGYIDCSQLANPADKYAMCPSFTPDGAHLTEIGSIAMADFIPLTYVGANTNNVKTAAQINNVDPYKEKKQIIYDMEHPTTTTPETLPPEEKPTINPENTTNNDTIQSNENSAENNIVTEVASSYSPQTTLPYYDNTVTVPVINEVEIPPEANSSMQDIINPEYNVEDTETESIGNGIHIGFLMILFLIVIVAGVILVLVLGRKRDEEY